MVACCASASLLRVNTPISPGLGLTPDASPCIHTAAEIAGMQTDKHSYVLALTHCADTGFSFYTAVNLLEAVKCAHFAKPLARGRLDRMQAQKQV